MNWNQLVLQKGGMIEMTMDEPASFHTPSLLEDELEGVDAGIEVGVTGHVLRAGVDPLLVETLHGVGVLVALRGGVVGGRELERDEILVVRQLDEPDAAVGR